MHAWLALYVGAAPTIEGAEPTLLTWVVNLGGNVETQAPAPYSQSGFELVDT